MAEAEQRDMERVSEAIQEEQERRSSGMSGNEFDSKEEQYIEWYLQELKDNGILIDFFFHPETFTLVDGTYYDLHSEGRAKPELRTMCQSQTYTPDFLLIWNKNNVNTCKFIKSLVEIPNQSRMMASKKEKSNFFWEQKGLTYIDVKPLFQRQQSRTAVFSLKRAIMLKLRNTHIQAVIYQHLFEKTFTPKRFLTCDISNKARKINFKTVTLEQFTGV